MKVLVKALARPLLGAVIWSIHVLAIAMTESVKGTCLLQNKYDEMKGLILM